MLIPFGDVVLRSFFQAVGGRFVGIDNYIQVLSSDAFRRAVSNTMRFIMVCIPLLMAFSLWVSVLVSSVGKEGGLYKTTILLPMAIPVASVVLLWKMVFYPAGLLSQLAVALGGMGQDWLNRKSAFTILIVTYLWKNTGYDMMLWLAGLNTIPGELYEAARVDGAASWQSFYYVTLPCLKQTAFLVMVLSVINSFKVFREVYLISGDYPHESIYMMQHLFNNWFVSLDIQKMSSASVLIEAGVLIPVILWMLVRKKR